MSKGPEREEDQQIEIGLPERHWVILLAILDETIRRTIAPAVEKLREHGTTLQDVKARLGQLDEAEVTALTGPVMIRGIIVKELVARGIMTPEADEQMGIDTLMKHAADFQKKAATASE